MEIKKSEKASLENKRLLFTEIGFVVALLLVYGAFEFSSKDSGDSTLAVANQELFEEEYVPITEVTPPPPPETPDIPQISDEIDIVEDDMKVDDALIISEDDANFGVEIKEYIAEQPEEEEVEEEVIPFALVQDKPKFMNGDPNAFSKWVNERLEYPEIAKENGIQGRVMISFKVGTDGKVSDVKVLRGVDPSLDKEAVRVVSQSPKWTPGKQRDRAVAVTYTFPVIFQLR